MNSFIMNFVDSTYFFNIEILSETAEKKAKRWANDPFSVQKFFARTNKTHCLSERFSRTNRVRNPDFISEQKTLELSQSGIGFVMGWNLAKS